GGHLLFEGNAGTAGVLQRGLKLRQGSGGQGQGQDARLIHRGRLSRQGNPGRVAREVATSFLVRSASFFHPLCFPRIPQPHQTALALFFSLVSPEWGDTTPPSRGGSP